MYRGVLQRKWGELQVILSPSILKISEKEACGNFEAITNFALFLDIYPSWTFQKFFPNRSRETSEEKSPQMTETVINFYS
jgi:hypothetical protein